MCVAILVVGMDLPKCKMQIAFEVCRVNSEHCAIR